MIRPSLIASLLVLFLDSLANSAERVRIAYSSISAAYVGIWVARDAGFFAKEGLEDQIIFIPSATQLAQVLVAGDVDIASLGGGPVMAASLSGADLKVIGNNVNKLIFSIHAKPEVKSLEDLRGKRIAVSRFGSAADIAARTALQKTTWTRPKMLSSCNWARCLTCSRRSRCIGSFAADAISVRETGI